MVITHGRPWLTVLFLVPWTFVTLVFDLVAVLMFAGVMAGGFRLALFLVLFLLPFNAIAVASWVTLVAERRDRRSATGIGRPKHTRDRWEVMLPSSGPFAVSMAVIVTAIPAVFATAFASGRMPPPWWGTLGAIVVVAGVAGWAYRVWGFRPVVVIDEKRSTVTFRTARGAEDSALWVAVKDVQVYEVTATTEDDGTAVVGFAVNIKLEGKGGTRFVALNGRREREPVEVFAAWLCGRIGLAHKRNSPTAPRVH